MKNLYLLIKPISSSCQMKCTYCFYHDTEISRTIPNYGKMSEATTSNLIKKALNANATSVTFGFQGGEPTLIGISFFENFVKTVKFFNKKEVPIFYAIQTNGLLIDNKWSTFFYKNDFLVGVSLDGYKDIHDTFRVDINNKPTFDIIFSKLEILKKHNVKFNILSVVTNKMAKKGPEVYNFYKLHKFDYIQFLPCIDAFNDDNKHSKDIYLTPENYGNFLIEVFDLWFEDIKKGSDMSIRFYDDLAFKLSGRGIPTCQLMGHCTEQYAVEADGEVYPCDFYILDNYKLGNINEKSISKINETRKVIKFIEESAKTYKQCKKCQWWFICGGGCRRDRHEKIDSPLGKPRYCESYKMFFAKEFGKLMELSSALQH